MCLIKKFDGRQIPIWRNTKKARALLSLAFRIEKDQPNSVRIRLVVVPLTEIEPVRYLYRGILRRMRQKQTCTTTIKNRAFSAKNSAKMPKNQTFPFAPKSLKSATSQNFPKIFTESHVLYSKFCRYTSFIVSANRARDFFFIGLLFFLKRYKSRTSCHRLFSLIADIRSSNA